jgi:hypothetical protein
MRGSDWPRRGLMAGCELSAADEPVRSPDQRLNARAAAVGRPLGPQSAASGAGRSGAALI